jgi:LysR family transcriptional regulator, transcriptional activator of nhaA
MSPWINYHHLLYFKTIAEEGSVSKASEKLLVGQPTLSAQLKIFEDTLGVQLFERHHKKLVLTEQGKVALDYARNIFQMGSEMYEVLHDRMMPARTHLQIGSIDSVPKRLTLALTKRALKMAKCQVSLVEGRPEELMRELLAHRIDIVVSNFVPKVGSNTDINYKLLVRNPVSIYGAAKFKDLAKNFPQSLNSIPFVMPTYDSKIRYDLEHWFKTNQVNVDIVAETQDITLKKLMGVDSLGLIAAANYQVGQYKSKKELIEIGKVEGVFEELYLISAKRKIENPIARELMKSFTV